MCRYAIRPESIGTPNLFVEEAGEIPIKATSLCAYPSRPRLARVCRGARTGNVYLTVKNGGAHLDSLASPCLTPAFLYVVEFTPTEWDALTRL
jgi:hypothetical protein